MTTNAPYPGQFLWNISSTDKATCFVLMPFDTHFDEVYLSIKNSLQSPLVNMLCTRADDILRPNIFETILRGIARSEYVIADLTNSNPNVFYELGITHTRKKSENVLLLSQSLTAIPFDLRHLRCIIYEPTDAGLTALRAALVSSFSAVSHNQFRFRVYETKEFQFGRKLAGRNNNLYSIRIKCHYVGYDCVKLSLEFEQFSMDQGTKYDESQFLFLSRDAPVKSVSNVPWNLFLADLSESDALLVLERDI